MLRVSVVSAISLAATSFADTSSKHCRVVNSSSPFWLDCGSGNALTLGANHVSNNCVGPGVDDGKGSHCATQECTCMTWDSSINASAYRAATLGLYVSDAGWAKNSAARLAQWGFNTAGAWSSTEMETQPGIQFAVVLDMGVNWVQTVDRLFPDVFDKEWKVNVTKIADRECKPRASNQNVLGYFADNGAPPATLCLLRLPCPVLILPT